MLVILLWWILIVVWKTQLGCFLSSSGEGQTPSNLRAVPSAWNCPATCGTELMLAVGLRWLQPREAFQDLSAERGLRPLPDVKALKQLWSVHFIFCWLVYCLISAVQCKLHDGGDLFMLVFQETQWSSVHTCSVLCAKLLWCVCRNPMDCIAQQASLSVEFSRQEYWSGLLCSPPGDVPDLEIEPASLTSPALAGGFFTTSTTCMNDKYFSGWKLLEVKVLSSFITPRPCDSAWPYKRAFINNCWMINKLEKFIHALESLGKLIKEEMV